ncbi:MAG: pilus assembly protein [Lachnospiraceae bacterium]|nr:pilus assembly protein [Lachnospiraceae bacterium]
MTGLLTLSGYRNGSITIETAMVLPIFLFGMFAVIDLFSMLGFYMGMERALDIEAKKLCIRAYDSGDLSGDAIESDIVSVLSESVKEFPVEGGKNGIDFGQSDIHNREIIILQADYVFKPNFDVFGITNIQMSQRRLMHTWIGYEQGLYGGFSETEDAWVYVAKNGAVYHKNLMCSHIKLSIMETTGKAVDSLRNIYGGRYKPCEICHAKKGDRKIYVPANGDRYHNSLNCSGLKRTVSSIRLSEAVKKGLRACSRCGAAP